MKHVFGNLSKSKARLFKYFRRRFNSSTLVTRQSPSVLKVTVGLVYWAFKNKGGLWLQRNNIGLETILKVL